MCAPDERDSEIWGYPLGCLTPRDRDVPLLPPYLLFAASEEAVDGAITDAINSVMAYNETAPGLGTGGAAGALPSWPLAAALLLGLIGVLA